MPTGYTSTLYEREQSFRDYALDCARAFGACIELRDSPSGPAPRELPLDTHYRDSIELAKRRLEIVKAWTDEEAQAESDAEYMKAKERYAEQMGKAAGRLERYGAALAAAKAWEPPTPDHVELKAFMIQQIETCWDETTMKYHSSPLGCPGPKYRDRKIAEAERELVYAETHWQEEQARNKMRNSWLRLLHESLPPVEAPQ